MDADKMTKPSQSSLRLAEEGQAPGPGHSPEKQPKAAPATGTSTPMTAVSDAVAVEAEQASAAETSKPPAAAAATHQQVPGASLPNWRKYLILFVVSWNCLVVTSNTSSLMIATPEVSASLSTTPEILNVVNAGVLVAMGLSSLLWGPLGQLTTRRLAYNLAILVTLAASVGTASSPDMPTFTAMRLLSGFTGTYFMVAGQTVIADIFVPVQRGRATGFFQIGAVAGSAIGPAVGGILVTYSRWRSIYWLQVAQCGLGLVLSLVFVPDIRPEVAQRNENKGKNDYKKETDKKEDRPTPREVARAFNPLRVFRLFLRPYVFLADLACGSLALSQYGLLASVRHVVNPRFGLTTPLISGLIYIAPGVGFILGALVGGRLSDRTVRAWVVKRGGTRLPRDRLNSGYVHFFGILPLSMLLYGWSLQAQFGGLALPIVTAFWIGIGLMGAWNGLNTYTAEVCPAERSECVSTKYILQYAFGAASTAAILPMIQAIGVGWSFTIFTVCNVLCGFVILFIARLAPYDGIWAYRG